MPHRPVIKLPSTTTKIRPVSDASNKRPGYASLNECVSIGLDAEYYTVFLYRFRYGTNGVITDIKHAFLLTKVIPKDRDFLSFTQWGNKYKNELKFYRHCRVVFGV